MPRKKSRKRVVETIVKGRTKDTTGRSGCGGVVYILGFLGAAIYYIVSTTGFWSGVVGVLKALVWPAFLVYELFSFLGM